MLMSAVTACSFLLSSSTVVSLRQKAINKGRQG